MSQLWRYLFGFSPLQEFQNFMGFFYEVYDFVIYFVLL